MGESFVDVSYRGLDLGRRLKLCDVRPDTAYVEIPLPMPVGTTVDLVTDDGHRIAAKVTAIHEQVGGSEHHPGMRVAPVSLGAAEGWWKGLVEPGAIEAADDTRTTQVMSTEAVEEALAAGGGTPVYVDDGKKTTVMDAVDLERITGASPEADDDEAEIIIEGEDSGEMESSGEVSGEMPLTPSGKVNGKRAKKRGKRKKR